MCMDKLLKTTHGQKFTCQGRNEHEGLEVSQSQRLEIVLDVVLKTPVREKTRCSRRVSVSAK